MGSLSSGRGFFLHSLLPTSGRQGLEKLRTRQEEAGRRRQRHLQQRVRAGRHLYLVAGTFGGDGFVNGEYRGKFYITLKLLDFPIFPKKVGEIRGEVGIWG